MFLGEGFGRKTLVREQRKEDCTDGEVESQLGCPFRDVSNRNMTDGPLTWMDQSLDEGHIGEEEGKVTLNKAASS